MKKVSAVILAIFFTASLLMVSRALAQETAARNGKYITVKGLTLYYEETGSGSPLLLLHGFSRTATDWRPYTTELARYHRVIAMDLPGHGRSDFMDTTPVYLHRQAAEYIIAALDSLHIDSVHVLGHSSGAFITLYMATLRPHLTKNIIVVSGQLYYSTATRQVITAQGDPEKNTVMRMEGLVKSHGKLKGKLIGDQFWHFRKLYGDPLFTPDVLASVKARAFIIHGDNDPIAPVSHAWEMFQHIPRASLWIVPNGDHVPQRGPGNKEEFLRQVIAFLQNTAERR